MEKIVYAVISKKKLHVFGSWSRRDKILQRADKFYKRNMAHEVWEVTNAGIKTGDPYKSKKAERGWQPVDRMTRTAGHGLYCDWEARDAQ